MCTLSQNTMCKKEETKKLSSEAMRQKSRKTHNKAPKKENSACLFLSLSNSRLVGGLGAQRDEVPEHVRVFEVRLRVPLLRVDKAVQKCAQTRPVASEKNPICFSRWRLNGDY